MAAHVEQDSELFTNLVSAKAIPAGKAFYAIRDQQGAPSIFSLGTDSVVYLFTQIDGKLQNINFSAACGFTDPVTALAVSQQHDSSLFITFAVEKSKRGQIVVLPGVLPANMTKPNPDSFIESTVTLPEIHEIFISDYSSRSFNGHYYPDVVVGFQPLERISKEEDCGLLEYVEVKNAAPQAFISKRWSLPINADEILDLAFARSVIGDGVVVLYKAQDNTRLVYSVYDSSLGWSVAPDCPEGATCLGSFVNPPGSGPYADYSSLLVGGKDITYYTSDQYVRKNKTGVSIVGSLMEPGLKDLHVAQDGTNLTFWFTNTEDAAGYYHVTSSELITQGSVVSLLPKGQGGRLSGMISSTAVEGGQTAVNTIISVSEDGHLTSLQQSAAQGSWNAYPLMMSTKTTNFEVQSYTTRLRIMEGANRPSSHATFLLQSTGRVSAIVNGSETSLSEAGMAIQADASGEATFIVATADVSSHTFDITNIRDQDGKDLEIGLVYVNPAAKGMEILQGITDGDKLKEAELPNGKKLIDADKLDPEDVKSAGGIIGQLSDHGVKLSNTLSRRKSLRRRQLLHRSNSTYTAPEWWQWVTHKVHDAEEWFIDQVEDGIAFVVRLAGEAFTFILDGIAEVGKALQFVFEKLKVAFDDLIEFLGFLFDWDDIKDCKNTLSKFLTVGLEWTAGKIDAAKKDVDTVLEKARDAVQKPRPTLPAQPVNQGPPKTHSTQQSMGFNWSKYHLVHSGGSANYQPKTDPSDPPLTWTTFWTKDVRPAMNKIENDIKNLVNDIERLFKDSDQSVSIADGLKAVGEDLVVMFLDVLTGIVNAIMDIVKSVVIWIKNLGNHVIEIPVFSALYKKIAGADLTVFDGICLIIAIPATVLAKVITKKALPNLTNVLSVNVLQAYVDGTSELEQRQQINSVAAYGSISAGMIGVAIGMIGLAVDNIDPVAAMHLKRKHQQVGDPSAAPTPIDEAVRGYDLVNLVTGLSNFVLAVPTQATIDKVGQKWEVLGMWWTMAGRWLIAAVLYAIGKKIENKGTKAIIAIFNSCAAAFQYGLQVSVAVKAGGGDEVEGRRIAIATCYMAGTLSRMGASLSAYFKQPEVEAVMAGLFCYFALGSTGLQIWNIDALNEHGGWWDGSPTVL